MIGVDLQRSSPAIKWSRALLRATLVQRQAIIRLVWLDNPCTLAPFVPMKTGGGWRLGMCMEPPPHLDAQSLAACRPVGDVVMIDPSIGDALPVGNGWGWIVGNVDPLASSVRLYTNGLSFARAWASSRVAWVNLYRLANVPGLPLSEPPDHALPGMLLTDAILTFNSLAPLVDRQRVIVDDPGVVRLIATALLRSKRVPIVEMAGPRRRKAA